MKEKVCKFVGRIIPCKVPQLDFVALDFCFLKNGRYGTLIPNIFFHAFIFANHGLLQEEYFSCVEGS